MNRAYLVVYAARGVRTCKIFQNVDDGIQHFIAAWYDDGLQHRRNNFHIFRENASWFSKTKHKCPWDITPLHCTHSSWPEMSLKTPSGRSHLVLKTGELSIYLKIIIQSVFHLNGRYLRERARSWQELRTRPAFRWSWTICKIETNNCIAFV